MKSGSAEKSPLAKRIADEMPPSQLYTTYSPDLQNEIGSSVTSIADISDIDGVPLIKDIADAYDDQCVAVDWIKTQLEVVNTFSNVSKRLNTEQLIRVGEQIYGISKNLNLLEIIMFCSRLRTGRYEKWYGAIDAQKILISLESFLADRSRDIAYKREQEYGNMKMLEDKSSYIDARELIKTNPGKYPTLEKLMSGKGISVPLGRNEPKKKYVDNSKLSRIMEILNNGRSEIYDLRSYLVSVNKSYVSELLCCRKKNGLVDGIPFVRLDRVDEVIGNILVRINILPSCSLEKLIESLIKNNKSHEREVQQRRDLQPAL